MQVDAFAPARPGARRIVPREESVILAVVALVALAALVMAVTGAVRPAATQGQASGQSRGVRPALIVQADGAPYSVLAWYADGTQGDASDAITRRWVPDRPVLSITVAAGRACSITVDDRLAVAAAAPVNRLAVCLWRAP